MSLVEELKTRNFSIYGQWIGVLCIILCIALGIANIFHASLVIIFSIICMWVWRGVLCYIGGVTETERRICRLLQAGHRKDDAWSDDWLCTVHDKEPVNVIWGRCDVWSVVVWGGLRCGDGGGSVGLMVVFQSVLVLWFMTFCSWHYPCQGPELDAKQRTSMLSVCFVTVSDLLIPPLSHIYLTYYPRHSPRTSRLALQSCPPPIIAIRTWTYQFLHFCPRFVWLSPRLIGWLSAVWSRGTLS